MTARLDIVPASENLVSEASDASESKKRTKHIETLILVSYDHAIGLWDFILTTTLCPYVSLKKSE